MRAAIDAADALGLDGGLDDVLLLATLVRDADDDVLRALGPRARQLSRDADAMLAETSELDWRVPDAEDVVHFAAGEAIELNGYGAAVGPLHVLLALFAFSGSRSEQLLRAAGLEWRPLRSIIRRLGLGW